MDKMCQESLQKKDLSLAASDSYRWPPDISPTYTQSPFSFLD